MPTHPSPPPCAQLFGFRVEGHRPQREGPLCDWLWCSLGLFCLDLYTNLARGLQVGVDRRWPPQAPADEKLHCNSSLCLGGERGRGGGRGERGEGGGSGGGAAGRVPPENGYAWWCSQPPTPILASEVHISLSLHGQGLIYPLLAHLGS